MTVATTEEQSVRVLRAWDELLESLDDAGDAQGVQAVSDLNLLWVLSLLPFEPLRDKAGEVRELLKPIDDEKGAAREEDSKRV